MRALVWPLQPDAGARRRPSSPCLPLFGGINVPRTVKVGLAVALTVVWFMPHVERRRAAAIAAVTARVLGLTWLAAASAAKMLLGGMLGLCLGIVPGAGARRRRSS